MKIKYLLIPFIFLILINCGSSTVPIYFTNKPPFSILKIYSQKWVAGLREGGSGTNLYVSIKDASEGVEIKEFYFGNKITEAKLTSENNYVGYFKNEINRDVIMESNVLKEAANIPPQKSPFQLTENEAIISYSEKGKMYYFKISAIKEKPQITYPNSNSKIEN